MPATGCVATESKDPRNTLACRAEAGGTGFRSDACQRKLRRDQASTALEVRILRHALEGGETIVTTGLVLQELLQGFAGRRARKDIY